MVLSVLFRGLFCLSLNFMEVELCSMYSCVGCFHSACFSTLLHSFKCMTTPSSAFTWVRCPFKGHVVKGWKEQFLLGICVFFLSFIVSLPSRDGMFESDLAVFWLGLFLLPTHILKTRCKHGPQGWHLPAWSHQPALLWGARSLHVSYLLVCAT